VEEVGVAGEVLSPQLEVLSTPTVPQPEPHPETSAATKSGTTARIRFVCPKRKASISWSPLFTYSVSFPGPAQPQANHGEF
jgi:hypothetical protein